MKYELQRIEADVVIVITNTAAGIIEVHPHWECGLTDVELSETAAYLGLEANERHGCGYVVVEIHDFRSRAE